jgi:hypothetical protein
MTYHAGTIITAQVKTYIATTVISSSPFFHNLPRERNAQFRFRVVLLDALTRHLSPGRAVENAQCARLYGEPGVGKIELAMEYAYQCLNDCDAIFRIQGNAAQIQGSIGNLERSAQPQSSNLGEEVADLMKVFEELLEKAQTEGIHETDFIEFVATRTNQLDTDSSRDLRWLLILDYFAGPNSIES